MGHSNGPEQARTVIEFWADLGCPWSYIGKHRLQRAIEARPDAERFEVKIRSFQLQPESPREPETMESVLIRTYGGDASAAMRTERQAQELAHSEGLAFDLDRMNANTFDLHRVVHQAEESGKGLEFFSQVQDRFFAGEINPYDTGALVSLAESLGIPGARVREVLAGDEHAAAVRADRADGMALGARGVPFAVFGPGIAVSGAQSEAGYAQALDEAVTAVPQATDAATVRERAHVDR